MMRPWLLLLLGCTTLAVAAAQDAYEYGYDYGYDGYDGLYGYEGYYDYVDDPYGYYEDDADLYYEEYGYYADDDFFGYEEYYDEYYDYYDELDQVQDCTLSTDGKVVLTNGTAPCDIKIEGVDKKATMLKGGLDGVYKLYTCHDGRPAYMRQDSPAGEDRVLFYSQGYGDWDISKGAAPTENDILMYGGDMEHHPVPLFVTSWHLGADLVPDTGVGEDYYVPVDATIKCADGKVYEAPKVNPVIQKQGPILTDEEIEAKYRLIYDTYGRRPEPNPTVNFSFVIMLVMIGLAIVLAIPYLLVRKARYSKGYSPVATSFAQVIQQSKKKSSGHIH